MQPKQKQPPKLTPQEIIAKLKAHQHQRLPLLTKCSKIIGQFLLDSLNKTASLFQKHLTHNDKSLDN